MTVLLGSRGTSQAGQPTWWASLAVRSASLPLPAEHRWRYRQEFLAELGSQVGATGSVVGVDASPQTLALVRRRTQGQDNLGLVQGDATALPVAEASFDRALSVQVLEYLPDPAAALGELHRVLRPGGRLVVWDVDWSTLSWHSADPDRMRRVLAIWDGHLADPGLPRTLAARAGFGGLWRHRRRGLQLCQHPVHPRQLWRGDPSPDPAVPRRP